MNFLEKVLLSFVLVLSQACATVLGDEYSEIVAFGASLTDGGNVYEASPEVLGFNFPVSPPNYMGRFSNGPAWVDVLADLIGVDRPSASETGGNNYAWSGATTGAVDNLFGVVNLDSQVEEFLGDKAISGEELFVIPGWMSLNGFSSRQPETANPAEAARKVATAIDDLASSGGSSFFLALGMTTSRTRELAPTMASFNETLLEEIESLRIAHPHASILVFDPQPIVDSFFEDPASIGVRFVTGNACNDCTPDNPNPVQIAGNPNDYLYWEGNHFTEPGHAALGRAAYTALVPEPSSTSLVLFGFAALVPLLCKRMICRFR